MMGHRYITPEMASERTGRSIQDLKMAIPCLKLSSRTLRFREADVDALVAGRFSWLLRRVVDAFPKLHEKTGAVYFIEAIGTDRVKIGFTTEGVDARRRKLQTASPFELREITSLDGSLGIERLLHRDHVADRILPTAEWFHLRGGLASFIEKVRIEQRWP